MRTFQFIFVCTIILLGSTIKKTHAQFWEEDTWGISYLGNNVQPPAHLGIGMESHSYYKASIASGRTYGTLNLLNNSDYETGDRTYNIYGYHDSEYGSQKVGMYNYITRKGQSETERIGIWNTIEQDDNSQGSSIGIKQNFYTGPADIFGMDQIFYVGKRANYGFQSIFEAEGKNFISIYGSNLTVKLSERSSGIVYGHRIDIHNKGDGLHMGLAVNVPGEDNYAAVMNGRVFFQDKVGIGQMPPSGYDLSVAGKIIAEELVIELTSNWPDYVFSDDYTLMPLEEVAIFIEQEKHLPGIAPAKEIEENGLSIGETQRRMMEKIEELTLYMINLKRENEQLKARLEKIEK